MEIKYKVVNKNNNHFSTSMRMIWGRVTQPLENIAGWEIDNPISYHSERRVAAKFIILFIFFCVKAPNKQPTSIHFCVGWPKKGTHSGESRWRNSQKVT